jgi:hypothetical protein
VSKKACGNDSEPRNFSKKQNMGFLGIVLFTQKAAYSEIKQQNKTPSPNYFFFYNIVLFFIIAHCYQI